jgi:hypothetical protein
MVQYVWLSAQTCFTSWTLCLAESQDAGQMPCLASKCPDVWPLFCSLYKYIRREIVNQMKKKLQSTDVDSCSTDSEHIQVVTSIWVCNFASIWTSQYQFWPCCFLWLVMPLDQIKKTGQIQVLPSHYGNSPRLLQISCCSDWPPCAGFN